ncbi:ArsR family transcriptional regulator [Actinokineospora sp. NBRC 105648]|nr:ArsR family transcriptional regulator [Actinokineospora sp. NBRC 105648]
MSKHLAVLEAANLVTARWRGREKLHHLNAEPIGAIADRWISRYTRERVHLLADLKRALEQPMAQEDFVYTTYIKTTPEQLWQALTDPAFTSQYWGATFTSEWTTGAEMTWHENGVTITDPAQVVLEADPPRRLSYTWHTLSREWADSHQADPEVVARMAAEPRSHVTFEIEEQDGQVRLTVVHGGFGAGSELREGVSQGWPKILADLKSLVEQRA